MITDKQMLEKANVRLNGAAIQVSEWFRKKGFRTCILKGQGNALMYPNGLHRTSASRLIVPPNEKYGKFVLNEVLEAGNFGKHDARNRFGRSKLGHNLQRVYRDMRLVRYFPAEALSEPIFRTWHFFWRLRHK